MRSSWSSRLLSRPKYAAASATEASRSTTSRLSASSTTTEEVLPTATRSCELHLLAEEPAQGRPRLAALVPGPGLSYLVPGRKPAALSTRKPRRPAIVLEPVTGRFGGAGRPSISPDGKTLTFISRDRLDHVLVAHDLATGAERIVFRGLNHDLQESFAWAGTYPGMDFMPDGKSIVLWADGRIQRVDLATGDATVIPFSVDVDLVALRRLRDA